MIKNVLIVDDSIIARSFIRRILEINGIDPSNTMEANNGVEALEILKRQKVDLIFTDLNMPEMDGEQLLKRIKSSPKLNHIPVVVITSSGNVAWEKKLLTQHARAVFTKPLSIPEVSKFLNEQNNG